MSPFLALPPRTLAEAEQEIARQREMDPETEFRLSQRRNATRLRSDQ